MYSAMSKGDGWKVHIIAWPSMSAGAYCGYQPKSQWFDIETNRPVDCEGCLVVLARKAIREEAIP